MSKQKRNAVILSLLMGGVMMISACQSETTTAKLRYPVENKEQTVVSTDLTLSDEDFLGEPTEYNERLASLCAVMAASSSGGAIPQENFHSLGFSHIAKFSYESGYREDMVGAVIASKKIKGQTLVFLVARGTQGREWYSNFDVGYEDEHKGFSGCADFLTRKLHMYLSNYEIDPDQTSFLITGYSRGAAAANILSKRLIDRYGAEAVRAYTFATPNTTTRKNSDDYRSIFNLVKSDDVFTAIPLSGWGYHRYGTDIVLGEEPSSPDEVRQVFWEITGEDFRGFDSTDSVDDFLLSAYELSPTVEDYYHKKYTIKDRELSVYDYMNIAAKFLCEEQTEDDSELLSESLDSPFSGVSAFFLSGVDIEELLFMGTFTKSSVSDSHSMVSYLILLNAEP